jgi:hypothetical protein
MNLRSPSSKIARSVLILASVRQEGRKGGCCQQTYPIDAQYISNGASPNG